MNELIKHTTRESYYPRSRGGHFPTASTYEAGESWPAVVKNIDMVESGTKRENGCGDTNWPD